MAKTRGPLHSLSARGGLGDVLSFARRMKLNVVEKKPVPYDAKSPAQLSWRHMFNKVVALWHGLSATEKQAWESLARPFHMTGYTYFISQSLRPNPGIYLPLQGGTMAGDIDMAKFRILKLPAPVDGQEPVNLTYYNANLPVGGYTEGARVYHNANQSIPDATFTALALNSERWDTDTIHDTVTNNSRLTCKTAGKYVIIGNINFLPHATGVRLVQIKLNGTTIIAYHSTGLRADNYWLCTISTIYDLAINDFIELIVYQSSGGALSIRYEAQDSPEFMMSRIG